MRRVSWMWTSFSPSVRFKNQKSCTFTFARYNSSFAFNIQQCKKTLNFLKSAHEVFFFLLLKIDKPKKWLKSARSKSCFFLSTDTPNFPSPFLPYHPPSYTEILDPPLVNWIHNLISRYFTIEFVRLQNKSIPSFCNWSLKNLLINNEEMFERKFVEALWSGFRQ